MPFFYGRYARHGSETRRWMSPVRLLGRYIAGRGSSGGCFGIHFRRSQPRKQLLYKLPGNHPRLNIHQILGQVFIPAEIQFLS